MAGIERLIPTKKLKTTRLAKLAKGKPCIQPFMRYDSEADILILMVVPPDTRTVVHYIDDHVALLYEHGTLEIVGMQVEGFERSFLPKHASVQRVWSLRESIEELPENMDFGDMILAVERMKPQVAREIVRASEGLADLPARELEAVFA
jgi:hypothetical protein